jgi:hypothetical protein
MGLLQCNPVAAAWVLLCLLLALTGAYSAYRVRAYDKRYRARYGRSAFQLELYKEKDCECKGQKPLIGKK